MRHVTGGSVNRELLTMRNAGKEGEGSARVDVGCELENQSCGARRTDGRREVGAAKRRLPARARARARVAVVASPAPPSHPPPSVSPCPSVGTCW